MRKDQVVTYHTVRVNKSVPVDYNLTEWVGKIGVVQPGGRVSQVNVGIDVPVKFDDEPNTIYYFKAEWLDDLDNLPPEVGDTILVRAKVIERKGNLINFRVDGEEWNRGWLSHELVHSVIERAPWYPKEPEVGTVARGINLMENTPMGTWVRQHATRVDGKHWFDLVHGGRPVTWKHVIDIIRDGGATLQLYEPTRSVRLSDPRPPE